MRRFLLAISVSAALVLSGPYIGLVRSKLRATFPGRFGLIVNAAILLLIAVAAGIALVRIRERRAFRYAALAVAVVAGFLLAHFLARGSAETIVVERFHFVEYGVITLLFYLAWRPRQDASTLVLAALAAFIVGVGDEALQWFVPDRIGELNDLQLNAAAIACGLLFSVGVDPPADLGARWQPGSAWRVGVGAALTVCVVAAFMAIVHLGYQVRDPQIGSFKSRYSASRLTELEAAHERSGSGPKGGRFSREDQYLTEALWHVQQRNTKFADDIRGSWFENLILERYFSSALALGHRWPPAQRTDAESRAAGMPATYTSDANRLAIYTWNRPLFCSVAGFLMVLFIAAGFIFDGSGRRSPPG